MKTAVWMECKDCSVDGVSGKCGWLRGASKEEGVALVGWT